MRHLDGFVSANLRGHMDAALAPAAAEPVLYEVASMHGLDG